MAATPAATASSDVIKDEDVVGALPLAAPTSPGVSDEPEPETTTALAATPAATASSDVIKDEDVGAPPALSLLARMTGVVLFVTVSCCDVSSVSL